MHCGTFLFCVLVHPSPPKSQPSRGITAAPSICSEMPSPDRSQHVRQGSGLSAMDSSGYSSSEDPNRKPIHSATSSSGKSYGSTVTGYKLKINSALFSLMGECGVLGFLNVYFYVHAYLITTFLYVLNRLDLATGQPNSQNCECSSSRYGVRVNVHFIYTYIVNLYMKWCFYVMNWDYDYYCICEAAFRLQAKLSVNTVFCKCPNGMWPLSLVPSHLWSCVCKTAINRY